jgi:hypothetical protein
MGLATVPRFLFPRSIFFLNEISEKSCSAAVALIVRQSIDFADYYLKKVPTRCGIGGEVSATGHLSISGVC